MAVQLVQEEDIPKANGIEVPHESMPALYNWPTTDKNGYKINEIPSGTGRKLRVVCVGAGASGINLAKFAQDQLKDIELIIYEKNRDVAGTWYENKYPYVSLRPTSVHPQRAADMLYSKFTLTSC